jgi:hydrogenase-4 component B
MMAASGLFFLFFALCGLGALLAAVTSDRTSPAVLAWISALAAVVVLVAAGRLLIDGHRLQVALWHLPNLGRLTLSADRLSALFIFVTGLVYLPVSVYSAGYLKKYRGRYSLKSFAVLHHLLFAAVVLVPLAGDAVLFLIGWEAMSILSYLLVSYEHEHGENVQAGFLMLAMGEVGTLAVIIAFLIMGAFAANLGFDALRAAAGGLGGSIRWTVFLLTFLGFGVKAGLVPLSSWLPRAHPVAPGNVSAVLSGVILNLGIYGIVRMNADILPVTQGGAGLVVLFVGAVSALVGILYATTDNDLKRMLAHSSIENMGIITVSLGAAFLFRIYGHPDLAGIALIVALYHMANHAVYKSLLFLGAGAVDTQTGSRDMNRLGGLIRKMPWTALFFLVGALSIAALPPFNGFVSEWLTLQVLLQSAAIASKGMKIAFALCGAGLALTAGLAVTCFVKAFAMNFLGSARSRQAENAAETGASMKLPMAFLAVMCLILGILPTYVIPVLNRTVSPLVHANVVDELVPPFFTIGKSNARFSAPFVSEFHDLGAQVGRPLLPGRGLVVLHQGGEKNPVIFAMSTAYTLVVLILLIGGAYAAAAWLGKKRRVSRRPAWDGGVRRLFPEMTYTATGFSNPVRVVFDAVFRPTIREDVRETVADHFRTAIGGERDEVHLVDRIVYRPTTRFLRWSARSVGRLHVGKINAYAACVLITLLLFLLFNRLM